MNARQKAKKYKQELEMLKRQTIKPLYIEREPRQIDSFVAKQIFSCYPYSLSDNEKKRILLSKLIQDEHFLNSVKLEKIFDEWAYPIENQSTYLIRLDVVRRYQKGVKEYEI